MSSVGGSTITGRGLYCKIPMAWANKLRSRLDGILNYCQIKVKLGVVQADNENIKSAVGSATVCHENQIRRFPQSCIKLGHSRVLTTNQNMVLSPTGELLDTFRKGQMYSFCPVCDGANLKRIWVVNGYAIAKCSTCSLIFVQNQVTTEELSAHYAKDANEAYTDHVYEEANAECLNYYYLKLGNLIRSRFPQPGKLLDIGCSRGWFLDVMSGWECHGNEIVAPDALAARKHHGDRIVTGTFEDYPIRENYFDVITMQDVFDHMRDPMQALEKCHRMLRPGGLIVIKVHNISCLYAKLTGQNFYAVIPPSHLFYYDASTLDRVLSKSGFQVVGSKFIGHLLKISTIFFRLSRDNVNSLAYRIYRILSGTALGEFKVHKNLHDLITVLAEKPLSV